MAGQQPGDLLGRCPRPHRDDWGAHAQNASATSVIVPSSPAAAAVVMIPDLPAVEPLAAGPAARQLIGRARRWAERHTDQAYPAAPPARPPIVAAG
jgi:hypothetical protein